MEKVKIVYAVVTIFVVSFLLGCVSQPPKPTATPVPTAPKATPTPMATPVATAKEEIPGLSADGKVLYNYITNVSNYTTWDMWPGKSAMYPSPNKTHGADYLTTYVNDIALSAINGKAGTMSEDSIIVKESYGPDKKLMAIYLMYKEDGYDPAHNDWFWARYTPNGTIQAQGKVDGCITCHGRSSANDYIFSSSLK